jgi:hypothetical protein
MNRYRTPRIPTEPKGGNSVVSGPEIVVAIPPVLFDIATVQETTDLSNDSQQCESAAVLHIAGCKIAGAM